MWHACQRCVIISMIIFYDAAVEMGVLWSATHRGWHW